MSRETKQFNIWNGAVTVNVHAKLQLRLGLFQMHIVCMGSHIFHQILKSHVRVFHLIWIQRAVYKTITVKLMFYDENFFLFCVDALKKTLKQYKHAYR